ncbi:DEKNAAC103227 [Brettanomyces naardenensis]|uniref:DEKNAAC103227 n=1 Tax=Brettanomyces naardenensis TaxID=13370 RepID=A0A448YMR7_BRENA|nr:DEKNAAC103227 [Brettanomyces naardenensis]
MPVSVDVENKTTLKDASKRRISGIQVISQSLVNGCEILHAENYREGKNYELFVWRVAERIEPEAKLSKARCLLFGQVNGF